MWQLQKIFFAPSDFCILDGTVDDFANSIIGAQMGTVLQEVAEDITDKDNVIKLTKYTDLVIELKNEKIEAIVTDAPVAEAYAAVDDSLMVKDIGIETVSRECL